NAALAKVADRLKSLNNMLTVGLACAALAAAQTHKPLVLAEQGSFFVGGETKSSNPPATAPTTTPGPPSTAPPADVTVNQMYVQYQTPVGAGQHAPVVMVHGCCLSSKTWETTPDGRMGWSEYFVRQHRPVYLADQSGRARSGFDAAVFNEVRGGKVPPGSLPNTLWADHQFAWRGFRFGPSFGTAWPDTQYPV